MDITPHVGEIALVVAVILLIFGLGRLPEISLRIARAFEPRSAPPDANGQELAANPEPSDQREQAAGIAGHLPDETTKK